MSLLRRTPKAAGQAGTGQRRLPGIWPLTYLVAFLLAALIGFHLFFPGGLVKTRLAGELSRFLPGQAEIGRAELAFPFRLQLGKVQLPQPDGWVLPQPSRIELSPLWGSLIGDPGLAIEAQAATGKLTARGKQSGALTASFSSLPFSIPLPQAGLHLAGSLTKGAAELSSAKLEEVSLQTEFGRLELTGLGKLGMTDDSLDLGSGELRLSGNGSNLQVKQLKLRGGDIDADLSGSLRPGKNAATSRLNLSITLLPGPKLDQGLAEMLKLLAKPGRDGSVRFRIRGTLAAPKIKK